MSEKFTNTESKLGLDTNHRTLKSEAISYINDLSKRYEGRPEELEVLLFQELKDMEKANRNEDRFLVEVIAEVLYGLNPSNQNNMSMAA